MLKSLLQPVRETGGRPVPKADLALMRQLDELYPKWPLYGSPRLGGELRQRGYENNHKGVQWLMRPVDLWAVYPKPRTVNRGVGIPSTSISSTA